MLFDKAENKIGKTVHVNRKRFRHGLETLQRRKATLACTHFCTRKVQKGIGYVCAGQHKMEAIACAEVVNYMLHARRCLHKTGYALGVRLVAVVGYHRHKVH